LIKNNSSQVLILPFDFIIAKLIGFLQLSPYPITPVHTLLLHKFSAVFIVWAAKE